MIFFHSRVNFFFLITSGLNKQLQLPLHVQRDTHTHTLFFSSRKQQLRSFSPLSANSQQIHFHFVHETNWSLSRSSFHCLLCVSVARGYPHPLLTRFTASLTALPPHMGLFNWPGKLNERETSSSQLNSIDSVRKREKRQLHSNYSLRCLTVCYSLPNYNRRRDDFSRSASFIKTKRQRETEAQVHTALLLLPLLLLPLPFALSQTHRLSRRPFMVLMNVSP